MKKASKKILAMVLALMMVLSLGATAFAAEEQTPADLTGVSVRLEIEGEEPVTLTPAGAVPAGTTIYELLGDKDALDKYPGYIAEITDCEWTSYTNADGTISMYLQSLNYGDSGEPYATKPLTEEPKDIIYNDEPVEFLAWKDGYGLISYEEGKSYTYCYAGYAWMYTVDGNLDNQNFDDLTMNQFVLHNENTVVLNYKVQSTIWTRPTPLSEHYPYLPE